MKDKKTILGEIKDILFGANKELKFLDAKSGDLILRVEADDFAEGMVVSLVTPDGLIPVEDGTYPLEDGRELYIVAGKIDKIEMPEEEMIEETIDETADIEMAETTLMDGTKVKVEGDVAVGNKVLVEKDGEYVQATEGQHNLADGKVIYVDADGLINEIQTPETKSVDEEMEIAVEAPAYVDETAGMTSSVTQEMFGGLEKRMAELEDKIKEMEAVTKEMAKYSKSVEDKIENFVKDTPAELEFKSLKSEFNSKIVVEKKTQNDNLEAIRNLRAKNK
jgi:hypothetical protein